MEEGKIGSLTPTIATGFSHNRCDDVDQLGEAGDFNHIAVVDECDQHASDEKGIRKIVSFFFDRPGTDPFFRFSSSFLEVVPDIPFIE